MRIVQITPGSGGSFYCENCLRDSALIGAMRKLGCDVVMVPMYLPVQGDEGEVHSDAPIFFGGVNVYLQQKWGVFRKTPRWLDRLFDRRGLLRWIGRRAKMISAKELGETTISMLRGEEGRQVKELERLVEWLSAKENRPDIICLSNALLTGLARGIKERLGVPVVSLLQDEDGFLDGLASPYSEKAWEIIAERSKDVDAYVAVSRYYADVMRQRMGLDANRISVVHIGISLDGYTPQEKAPDVPTIGYLSRMCPEKGLDTLVDAFIILKKDEQLKNVKLRIAGGKSGDDEVFLSRIRQNLDSCRVLNDVEFIANFMRESKIAFLRSLSLLSVPEKRAVSYGLYVLEVLAAGVPIVQPASGVFVELLDETGGGVLCEPNDAVRLAAAMKPLLIDRGYARRLGEQGREAVFAKFNIEQTARELVRIYEMIIQKFHRGK